MTRAITGLSLAVSLAFAGVAHAQEEDDAAITARFQAAAFAKQQAEDEKVQAAKAVTEREAKAVAAAKAKESAEAAADWAAMTPAERTAARDQRAHNTALVEAAKQGVTVKVDTVAKPVPAPEGPTVRQRVGKVFQGLGDGLKASGAKSTTNCTTTGSNTTCYTH